VFGALTQPVAETHESVVHTFESLQLAGAPLTQAPEAQMSLLVQALPSVQGPVLFEYVHPLDGLQASSVHTLPSLQSSAGPGAQLPA
jgi:hypothetical protein